MTYSDRYLAFMGMAPKRIPHWEHWSCPDAETYLTGIDYYEHPRLCRERLRELYPQLGLPIPETDTPIPRPDLDLQGQSMSTDEEGLRHVRWGDKLTGHWDWGVRFHSLEEVFAFSPLENADFTDFPMVSDGKQDFRSEEAIYQRYRQRWPAEWGDKAPEGEAVSVGFYNTMFMWPLLTFGWELFLEACLDPRFERIMDEFAEINRLSCLCPAAGQFRHLPRRYRQLARADLLAEVDAQVHLSALRGVLGHPPRGGQRSDLHDRRACRCLCG